jgi:protein SCO1
MIKFKTATQLARKAAVVALVLAHAPAYSQDYTQAYAKVFKQAYTQALSQSAPATTSQALPEDSLYQLINNTWLDQDGHARLLSSFSGKKQIVSLIYTQCSDTCPTIVSTMQAIENKLSDEDRDNVGFILVSLTPDNDTPAVLQQFARSRKLSAHHWSLLTGSRDDVRNLVQALNLSSSDKSALDHSNLITVVDQQGRIKLQKTGVISNAAITVAALNNF